MENKPYVIGLDLGGTNSVFGIVDQEARIVERVSVPTPGHDTAELYVKDCVSKLLPLVDRVGGLSNIQGMGIGAPNGNFYTGEILYAANLPWKGRVSLAKLFETTLGVPVVFSDISEFEVICEVAESSAGYNPELSYGSHIFQDLVEAEIMYTAIFQNTSTLHWSPEKFTSLPNAAAKYCEEKDLANIIGVYDVEKENCRLLHDLNEERMLCILNRQDAQE